MANHRNNKWMMETLLRLPFQTVISRIHTGLVAAGYTDISPAHFVIWEYIQPEGSRITQLAEQAQITKQSISYLIRHLEAQGYVERTPDLSDGRARIVRLTERGRAVGQTARQIEKQIEEEWAGYLGEEQVRQLRQTLIDLNNQLSK